MSVLVIAIFLVCGLTAALSTLYAVKDIAADLLPLGAMLVVFVLWLALGVVLVVKDVSGGTPPDAVLLYGYVLSAIVVPLGAIWLGVWERSRYGSVALAVAAVTELVLVMRVEQLWPAAF